MSSLMPQVPNTEIETVKVVRMQNQVSFLKYFAIIPLISLMFCHFQIFSSHIWIASTCSAL
jgi:hypothetical protein